MAPGPPPAVALMDELVEEILRRIPPDDPGSLLRAALVCKRWRRIVSPAGFRHRFCEFHRNRTPAPLKLWDDSFVVWDPISSRGDRARLPSLPRSRYQDSRSTSATWNAAVLCASTPNAEGCEHLDCHSGPFLVVFVARGRRWGRSGMCAHVYSSEAAAWSQRIYAPRLAAENLQLVPSALAGSSIYFLCSKSVLRVDLAARELSQINLPGQQTLFDRAMLRATGDAALGLAGMCSDGLHLCSSVN